MDAVNDQGNFQTPALSKRDDLHPYTQSLSINDIDSCTKLEEETFPPNERATREKVSLHVLSFYPTVPITEDTPLCCNLTCWCHNPSLHAFSASQLKKEYACSRSKARDTYAALSRGVEVSACLLPLVLHPSKHLIPSNVTKAVRLALLGIKTTIRIQQIQSPAKSPSLPVPL